MGVDVVLVYPFLGEDQKHSDFRYPPLGLGYIAAVLRESGIEVRIIDGTFLTFHALVSRVRRLSPRIVGIYVMVTLERNASRIARALRNEAELLIAGGPLPSLLPGRFLEDFDIVVRGEGEHTMMEIAQAFLRGQSWSSISGITYRNGGSLLSTPQRELQDDLELFPPPARDLFPNESYQRYWRKQFGFTATSQMTTRGCPFSCDFCSSPVFGKGYRERTPESVVAEMRTIDELGYDRVFFSDDCFTLNPRRVRKLTELLTREKLNLQWMCLSRVDHLDDEMARRMAQAGCARIYFGIESGNERMLKIMKKNVNLANVQNAVRSASKHGIETGGFFILGYPGETNESLLDTVNLSSSLGLDYVSYSYPFPIVGTGLYERARRFPVRSFRKAPFKNKERHNVHIATGMSQVKLDFARNKGKIQHKLRQYGVLGNSVASVFEKATDELLRRLI